MNAQLVSTIVMHSPIVLTTLVRFLVPVKMVILAMGHFVKVKEKTCITLFLMR